MSAEPRSAAEAFDALAVTVSAQTTELRKLAAAIDKNTANYDLTLGRMARDIADTSQDIHCVSARLPPVGLPGESQLTAEMEQACDRMQDVIGLIQKACGSAVERQVQRKWMAGMACAGFAAGVALCVGLAVNFPRQAGALIAAGIVGESDWNVGQALMRRGDPEGWDRMARLYNACPQDVATEWCEAATAVRTLAPGTIAQSPTAGTTR